MCRGRVREQPEAAPPPRSQKDHPLAHAPKAGKSARVAKNDLRYMRSILLPCLVVMAVGNAAMRSPQGMMATVMLAVAYLGSVINTRDRPSAAAGKIEALTAAAVMVAMFSMAAYLAVAITCGGLYGMK